MIWELGCWQIKHIVHLGHLVLNSLARCLMFLSTGTITSEQQHPWCKLWHRSDVQCSGACDALMLLCRWSCSLPLVLSCFLQIHCGWVNDFICQGANSLLVINIRLAEKLFLPVAFSSCCYWYSCVPIRRHGGTFDLSCMVLHELRNVSLCAEESLWQTSARWVLQAHETHVN